MTFENSNKTNWLLSLSCYKYQYLCMMIGWLGFVCVKYCDKTVLWHQVLHIMHIWLSAHIVSTMFMEVKRWESHIILIPLVRLTVGVYGGIVRVWALSGVYSCQAHSDLQISG